MAAMSFERGSTASAVATLLGFSDATADSALGFRMNYEALENQGAFKDATTVGHCLEVYCAAAAKGIKL